MKQYLKVTYRDIAKMLSSALPVEGDQFGAIVEENLKTIKALTTEAKNALKTAYIFSRKVPREEREDMFQELTLAVLQVKTKDERFAYAIARCDWRNWWDKYTTRSHFMAGSLNDTVLDSDNEEVELAELVVGEAEFERKMDGKLDAQRIWAKLPDDIKPIILKRLLGKALNHSERNKLNYYARTKGTQILLS